MEWFVPSISARENRIFSCFPLPFFGISLFTNLKVLLIFHNIYYTLIWFPGFRVPKRSPPTYMNCEHRKISK
jgi:hypothetical protein